jgi:hypothetical protein
MFPVIPGRAGFPLLPIIAASLAIGALTGCGNAKSCARILLGHSRLRARRTGLRKLRELKRRLDIVQ